MCNQRMRRSAEVGSYLLVRNALLNSVGQSAPVVIGVITMPFIVQQLGVDRFGLLALAWVTLSYFSLFDLGVGRATTKFLAEYLGHHMEEKQLQPLLWTSIMLNLLLGFLGGLFLACLVPFLVNKVFDIPSALMGEAKSTFYVLAASIPMMLATSSLQGILKAAQRFDLINAVSAPISALTYVIPAAVLPLDLRLPQIVVLLLLAKLGGALAYWVHCRNAFPSLRKEPRLDTRVIRMLFTFGGWVTISNIVSPVFMYLDRFLIGVLLSMAAVTYYTFPSEVITRIGFFPASLVATLFPAFSALGAANAGQRLERIYSLSIKYMILLMGPLVLILSIFAQKILQMWLGSDFVEESTLAFQMLSVGLLLQSLALTPFNLLQGLGRPDITARFHLVELPVYLIAVFFLVKAMGIAGAALAWSLRMGLDALLLFGVTGELYSFSISCFVKNRVLHAAVALLILAGSLWILHLLDDAMVTQIAVVIVLISLFALNAWRYILDATERQAVVLAIRRLAGVGGA